jgi:CRISPR-associated protein Cas1
VDHAIINLIERGAMDNKTFMKPAYMAERDDSDLLRKKMGLSKGTLHYMKQNTMSDKSFTLNTHVRERLEK